MLFHNLLSCLIPKRTIKNNVSKSSYAKIDCKIYSSKKFLIQNKQKKFSISNTVYGRRHSKLFTNFHVSWDTLEIHKIQENTTQV